jgi:hypothetical protein
MVERIFVEASVLVAEADEVLRTVPTVRGCRVRCERLHAAARRPALPRSVDRAEPGAERSDGAARPSIDRIATPRRSCHLASRRQPDRVDGVAAIATCPALQRLQTLGLGQAPGNEIGSGGLRALAASPYFAALQALDLSHNPAGEDGWRALANSRYLTRLTTLDVQFCELTATTLRVLARSPILSGITRLNLAGSRLGSGGARSADSPHLRVWNRSSWPPTSTAKGWPPSPPRRTCRNWQHSSSPQYVGSKGWRPGIVAASRMFALS